MIFGRLERIGRYRGLGKALDTAIDFLTRQDLASLPLGKTEVDGESVYVNRFDYDTVPENITEGHLQYIDIHVVVEGEEKVGVADVLSLRETDRKEEEDFLGFSGEFTSVCTLRPGDFLIVFPEDAHSPKLIYRESSHVKKAVVKVLDR